MYEDPANGVEIRVFKRSPTGKPIKVLKRNEVKQKGLKKAAEEHKDED